MQLNQMRYLKLPQPLVMSGLRGDTLKFGMIQTVHGAKDQ